MKSKQKSKILITDKSIRAYESSIFRGQLLCISIVLYQNKVLKNKKKIYCSRQTLPSNDSRGHLEMCLDYCED